jgi:hypothetical protein
VLIGGGSIFTPKLIVVGAPRRSGLNAAVRTATGPRPVAACAAGSSAPALTVMIQAAAMTRISS